MADQIATQPMASRKPQSMSQDLTSLTERIDKLLQSDIVLKVKDLGITGNDLIEEMGIEEGPSVGIILEFLLETVIDDPTQNERSRLLEISRKFYQQKMKDD